MPRKFPAVVALAAMTVAGALALATTAQADPSPDPGETAKTAKTAAPGVPNAGRAAAPKLGARTDPSVQPLRKLGDKANLKIGVAVNTDLLGTDATYRHLVATEFSQVTAENVMKWSEIEPTRGQYNYAPAQQLINFAKANDQDVYGHTLIWHSQLPEWVSNGDFTTAQFRQIFRQHIRTTLNKFKGSVHKWDVVNEAFNEDGTLRDSIFLQKLGPGYIEEAFRYAHQIAPDAKLFYNDYNIEGINPKSNAVYQMVREMQADGVPIDGVGLQSHFDIQYGYPADLLANMQRFADRKLQVAVTEADVRMDLPADPIKIGAQAASYEALLSSCLLVKNCTSFTTWGVSDKYSWIPGVFEGQGYALLWDDDYQSKPAYDTLRRDLAIAAMLRR